MWSFVTNRSAVKCGVLLQIAVRQVVTDCGKMRNFAVNCNGVSRVGTVTHLISSCLSIRDPVQKYNVTYSTSELDTQASWIPHNQNATH
jgi:hypothetical protein